MALSQPSEVQSAITLNDFFRVGYRYRVWYIAGLIIVLFITGVWTKLSTKYFKARTIIALGRPIPPEQRIGFGDVQGPAAGRNEQYQNVVQGTLAEQYLMSTDLLTSAAQRLDRPDSSGPQMDLYKLLGIPRVADKERKILIAKVLRTDLIQIKQIQNTGVMELSVELPAPLQAARYANICVDLLQEVFTDLDFGYYKTGLKIYREALDKETSTSQAKWDAIDKEYQIIQYDQIRERAVKKLAWDVDMGVVAKRKADISDKIAKWTVATDERAIKAAQPVRVIERATTPPVKSRPRSYINLIVAAALYTFVFALGLTLASYVSWSRRGGWGGRS
jgi:uncharacterized protein involved in exopolysaccharide biosynthesis